MVMVMVMVNRPSPICVLQTLLPGLSVSEVKPPPSSARGDAAGGADPSDRVYAHQMVRTDCRAQKLDAFLQPREKTAPAPGPSGAMWAESGVEMEEEDDAALLEALGEVQQVEDGTTTPDQPRYRSRLCW